MPALSQVIWILISLPFLSSIHLQENAASCRLAQAAVRLGSARTEAPVWTCWSAALSASVYREATRSRTVRWPHETFPRTPSWPLRASASVFTSPSRSRKLLLLLLPATSCSSPAPPVLHHSSVIHSSSTPTPCVCMLTHQPSPPQECALPPHIYVTIMVFNSSNGLTEQQPSPVEPL